MWTCTQSTFCFAQHSRKRTSISSLESSFFTESPKPYFMHLLKAHGKTLGSCMKFSSFSWKPWLGDNTCARWSKQWKRFFMIQIATMKILAQGRHNFILIPMTQILIWKQFIHDEEDQLLQVVFCSLTAWSAAQWYELVVMCNVNILSQITLVITGQIYWERKAALPSPFTSGWLYMFIQKMHYSFTSRQLFLAHLSSFLAHLLAPYSQLNSDQTEAKNLETIYNTQKRQR